MRSWVCCLLILSGCATGRAGAEPSPAAGPPPRSLTAIDAGDEPGGNADFRLIAAHAAQPYAPAVRNELIDFLARHPNHHQRSSAAAMLTGVLLLQGDVKLAKTALDENEALLPSSDRDFFGGLCAARLQDPRHALDL